MKIYKENYSLVKQIEDMKDGANIHRINSLLNLYHVRIRQYNRRSEGCDLQYVKVAEDKIRAYIKVFKDELS